MSKYTDKYIETYTIKISPTSSSYERVRKMIKDDLLKDKTVQLKIKGNMVLLKLEDGKVLITPKE